MSSAYTIYSHVGIEIITSEKHYFLAFALNSAPLLKHTYIMALKGNENASHGYGLDSGWSGRLRSTFSGGVAYAGC